MNFQGKLRTFKVQSIKNETNNNKNVNYDSFNFIDNVTNKKIAVKDVVTSYGTRKNNRRKTQIVFSPPSDNRDDNQWEQEIQELKDCLSMMKGTKLFQLDSLRNKIFKHLTQQKERKDHLGDTDEIIEKKKEIRLLIQSSINQLNRRQLTNYLTGNHKKINPKIITLNKNLPSSIKKHNIEKVLQEILQNIDEDNLNKKNKKQKIDISDIKLPGEDVFQVHMMDYLRKKIQANGQYLIYPGKEKQLYRRLHKSKPCCQTKIQNQSNTQFLTKIKFSELKPNERVQSLKKKMAQNTTKRDFSKQLAFQLIQHKLYFDLQVLTFTNPQVLTSIDNKGNTLLHIAAKNGQTEIFEFILKKKCHELLKIKNNFGKRPYDLAKFFGSKDIVKTIQSLENGKVQGYC